MTKPPETLGQFEQQVLTAVMATREDAYALQIYNKVCEYAGRQVNAGSTYVTLERLEKKGYIKCESRTGSADGEGRKRKFYWMTPEGLEVLHLAMETASRLSASFFESWRLGKWGIRRIVKATKPSGYDS